MYSTIPGILSRNFIFSYLPCLTFNNHPPFFYYNRDVKFLLIDKDEGMSEIGIQPHIHIPWTPEHIQEDLDLKLALQLLQNEEW